MIITFFVWCLCLISLSVQKCSIDEIIVDGIRIDSETVIGFGSKTDGLVSVEPGESTVRLFGCGLLSVRQVRFTSNTDKCNASLADHLVGPVDDFHEPPDDSSVAVTADFPTPKVRFYVCVTNTSKGDDNDEDWLHMGNTVFESFAVEDRVRVYYMPMPIQIVLLTALLAMSGLFSGLNLGLMSLDQTELKIIKKCGNPQEQQFANTIYPIRKTGNYLLCTLLFGNVIVNSAISILFDDLTSGLIALVVSSMAIVIFGEIIPQSVCNRYGLAVGARTIWITRFFMALTFPISYPVSKLLDFILGDEVGNVYNRDRLLELIRISKDTQPNDEDWTQVQIVSGALEFTHKRIKDIMTQRQDVFLLSSEELLDASLIHRIIQSGYTRIPVYGSSTDEIIGLLNVKDLALLDPDDKLTVQSICDFYKHQLRFVFNDTPLPVMFKEFQEGKYHLAFVTEVDDEGPGDPVYRWIGIVSLEDIIEEVFQTEIVDETDVITDNVSKKKRRRETSQQNRDFTTLFKPDSSVALSQGMLIATFQYLITKFEQFKSTHVNEIALQKIIKQNVVQANSPIADGSSIAHRYLYERDKPSDQFILILEGRVEVTVGKENLMFEAGPFHAFGSSVITNMAELLPRMSISGNAMASDTATCRKAAFVPDFFVEVTQEVTYLKISAATYMMVYHASLLSARGKDIHLFLNEIPESQENKIASPASINSIRTYLFRRQKSEENIAKLSPTKQSMKRQNQGRSSLGALNRIRRRHSGGLVDLNKINNKGKTKPNTIGVDSGQVTPSGSAIGSRTNSVSVISTQVARPPQPMSGARSGNFPTRTATIQTPDAMADDERSPDMDTSYKGERPAEHQTNNRSRRSAHSDSGAGYDGDHEETTSHASSTRLNSSSLPATSSVDDVMATAVVGAKSSGSALSNTSSGITVLTPPQPASPNTVSLEDTQSKLSDSSDILYPNNNNPSEIDSDSVSTPTVQFKTTLKQTPDPDRNPSPV